MNSSNHNSKHTVNYAAGEKLVRRINLADIVVTHNHRCPAPDLVGHFIAEGIVTGEGDKQRVLTCLEFVRGYALSEEFTKRQKYVDLLEKYESGNNGIVPLAISRRTFTEIHPINLRSFRAKNKEGSYDERYGIISGERRFMAAAYNHVKFEDKPQVGCISHSMTLEEATDMAFEENLKKREPTPLEYGRQFREYTNRVNPETNKPYSLIDVSKKFCLDYGFVRSREALTHLDEKDQVALEQSFLIDPANPDKKPRLSLTKAITVALAKKTGKDCTETAIQNRKESRRRAMTLLEVQSHFDASRESQSNDYLSALAAVMKITFAQAMKESKAREKSENTAA